MDSDEVARVINDELPVGLFGWLVDSDEVASDEPVVGLFGYYFTSNVKFPIYTGKMPLHRERIMS